MPQITPAVQSLIEQTLDAIGPNRAALRERENLSIRAARDAGLSASEIARRSGIPGARVSELLGGASVEDADVMIVPAASAYAVYRETSAYTCPVGRALRAVSYLGFYADKEIKPEITRILERFDDVEFSDASASRLREAGETTLADVVEQSLESDLIKDGSHEQVFLLSGSASCETVVLSAPIKHLRSGRGSAWTQNTRYVRLDALRLGPATTDDLR